MTVDGVVTPYVDAQGDEIGTVDPSVDILLVSSAYLSSVPGWLLDGPFACGRPDVGCAATSAATEFDEGAYLVFERVAGAPGPIAVGGDEWGPVFERRGTPGDGLAPGILHEATDAFLTRQTASGYVLEHFSYVGDAFVTLATAARSRWLGDSLLTLIPFRTDLISIPEGWNAFAGRGPTPDAFGPSDWLGLPSDAGLFEFPDPTRVEFGPPPT